MTGSTPTLPPALTGYTPYDDYAAQETQQGGRTHYAFALPLPQIPLVLPVPDPDVPVEDNRAVRLVHAQGFADYVRDTTDWHAGPVTARTTSETVRFDPFPGGDYGTMRIGLLRVPRNNRAAFRIIDGQHRVLGMALLLEQLSEDLHAARTRLSAGRRNGEVSEVLEALELRVRELDAIQTRIGRDSVAIDLVVEDDTAKARQVFVDVANNALGVTRSVTARFDNRKVVNRALNLILDEPTCPLLAGRIDEQLDRVVGSNPNLLGAKHLAEIVRALTVGINGRVSRVQEHALNERDLVDATNRFFEVLTEAFPECDAIASGTVSVPQARATTLVVSTTMLRVLAGVDFELRKSGRSDEEIVSYFRRLAPHMAAPVDGATASGELLIGATESGAFTEGAVAPGARTQQVKELVEVLSEWAATPPPGF